MKIFLIISLTLLFFQNSNGQNQNDYVKLSELEFNLIFGYKPGDDNTIYSLLGTGFFRTPRADNFGDIIDEWIETHPEAYIIPVTSMKPAVTDDLESTFIYCWVIQDNDTLNIHLIRNGCFPGGTMLRPKIKEEYEDWEKEIYKEYDYESSVEINIDQETYDVFIDKVKQAEEYATENRLGISAEDILEE